MTAILQGVTIMRSNQNELARTLKHEGVRVGEIIAYRAWGVIKPGWFRSGDDRLRSVFMRDYVWHPDEPAGPADKTVGNRGSGGLKRVGVQPPLPRLRSHGTIR